MGLFKNWKPKTIAGKILKGTTIGVLGAATIASGVGAIGGAIGGAGLLAGAAGGVGKLVSAAGKVASGTKTVVNKVSASAVNFVTGTNKEQREVINQVKDEARNAKEQLKFVDKLKKAGLSEAEAYAKAGISYVTGGDKKTIDAGTGFIADQLVGGNQKSMGPVFDKKPDNVLIYGGLALAGLFLIPKIMK